MWLSHFLYICLLRCEGKFYSHCLTKVPGTQWMHNVCLFNEWMKTVKIMNEDHPESCIQCQTKTGQTQSEDGGSQGQQILTGVGKTGCPGRGCLPALFTHPAQTLRPWPGDNWLAQGTSKGKASICLRALHRDPSIIAPCSQVIYVSHLPDSLSYSTCCSGGRQ